MMTSSVAWYRLRKNCFTFVVAILLTPVYDLSSRVPEEYTLEALRGFSPCSEFAETPSGYQAFLCIWLVFIIYM